MTYALYGVDAFAATPFSGNPAAVCFPAADVSDQWLQLMAAEMNLSETAFLIHEGDSLFRIRWFTPTTEVDLCGHATLAAAHVIYESERVARSERIIFRSANHSLTASQNDDGIVLDFPRTDTTRCDPPSGLVDALGLVPLFVGRAEDDYLVEVSSEKLVAEAGPDLKALALINMRGVIVTARSKTDKTDFVSRFFAPRLGIDEDPVTGSAHCALAPYWGEKLNKTKLHARQLSKRGGALLVEYSQDRVFLTGQAITIWHGAT